MKLIREEIESVEFLVEQKNGKKSMYIEGVFLQGNIKNRNGRMYPMETLRKEVGRYNDWVWDGGILREKFAEKTYKTINTLVDQKQLDEHKLDLFNNFLSNL
jgi:hypothetical protein